MRVPSVLAALIGALCALLAAGCAGPVPAGNACDPLAAHETSTSLTGLVAAGRHADGTVYAVDEPTDGAYRVFSSEGSELVRRRVAGTGQENSADLEALTLQVQEPSPFTLKVEIAKSGEVRMGVLRGVLNDKTFTIGTQGDVLTVDGGAVQGLTVRNLPGGLTVEYEADTADGRRLVVTRPTDDWGYEDFRLFLGSADHMEEREVTAVARASDGGTTRIRCVIEGKESEAFFPSPWRPSDQAYLEIGGVRQELSTDVDWAAGSLQYLCF
jgi:hypothetical protein